MLTRPVQHAPARVASTGLDQPDAGAALQPVDRQRQFVRAVARAWRCSGPGPSARRPPAAAARRADPARAARSSGRGQAPGWFRTRPRSPGSRSAARPAPAGRNARTRQSAGDSAQMSKRRRRSRAPLTDHRRSRAASRDSACPPTLTRETADPTAPASSAPHAAAIAAGRRSAWNASSVRLGRPSGRSRGRLDARALEQRRAGRGRSSTHHRHAPVVERGSQRPAQRRLLRRRVQHLVVIVAEVEPVARRRCPGRCCSADHAMPTLRTHAPTPSHRRR